MRCVVQKVTRASVTVAGEQVSSIGDGFLVLVGVEDGDTDKDMQYCADKLVGLRIFEDAAGKMNVNPADAGAQILIISQFTLLADARHGRRPSFIKAARPEDADPMFQKLVDAIAAKGIPVQTGRFRTHMKVDLLNDGPVTILLDSKKGF